MDDDEDIRSIVQFALEDDEDIELVLCESGADALAKLEIARADLILLDVMMPVMDGPSVLNRIRQLPHHVNVPVVFITAKVQPNEIKQFKAMGAIDVISKPFDPMQLPDQIKHYL
ncbi:MAG TPA: response regulator [Pseudomonadales bacterium]|nr:response regulator [Pseudomonadales bacterium]